jgi:SAM-dependent methyltransferase
LEVGFEQDVALIQAMSNYPLSIWDGVIDVAYSSLGASMYANNWVSGERGQEALKKHLKDVWRMLKPGGIFALSAPRPNPNWTKVLLRSLTWPLMHGRLDMLVQTIAYCPGIYLRSRFMKASERRGDAHYLHADEWERLFQECGFAVLEKSEGESYGEQGVTIVCQKGASNNEN